MANEKSAVLLFHLKPNRPGPARLKSDFLLKYVMVDEGPGMRERAPAGVEMRVPHMPRMRHVRPNFECDSNIRRSGGRRKAGGVGEQRLRRTDLNENRRKPFEIGKQR